MSQDSVMGKGMGRVWSLGDWSRWRGWMFGRWRRNTCFSSQVTHTQPLVPCSPVLGDTHSSRCTIVQNGTSTHSTLFIHMHVEFKHVIFLLVHFISDQRHREDVAARRTVCSCTSCIVTYWYVTFKCININYREKAVVILIFDDT